LGQDNSSNSILSCRPGKFAPKNRHCPPNLTTIDSLQYGYIANSNRLHYVNDRTNDSTTKLGDFKEYTNNTSQDYSYDPNGNMYVDNNKRITSIVYNHLNLPDSITVTGKGSIKYLYDASGNKLKKITREGAVPTPIETV